MSDAAIGARKGKIVMFADDSPTHRKMIQAVLKRAGFPSMGYEDANGLIRALATVTPRVLLLDVDMPRINGFEACKDIRGRYPQLTAPIIFFSARKNKESVQRAREAGAQDYIVKPFNPKGLVERLDHWSGVRIPARTV